MHIDEIKERKRKMEGEICEAVKKAADQFRDDTNYTPSAIYININREYRLGSQEVQHNITSVQCDVDIWEPML